jgi:hypothetical protein
VATRMLAESNPDWEKYINSDSGASAIWSFVQLKDPEFFEKVDQNKRLFPCKGGMVLDFEQQVPTSYQRRLLLS